MFGNVVRLVSFPTSILRLLASPEGLAATLAHVDLTDLALLKL
jgi:hypothetical protein